jgi:3-hydroxyacyl-[acyl-carrier-protein] dehydratase
MHKLKQEIVSSIVGEKTVTDMDGVQQCYRFGANFLGFAGHFPGYPILPAFVQLLTAQSLIEEHRGHPLELATVEKAKFHLPLKPEQEIQVAFQRRRIGERMVYDTRLGVAEGLASAFRLVFVEKEESK